MPLYVSALNHKGHTHTSELIGSLDDLFETHPHLGFHHKVKDHKTRVKKTGLSYIRQDEPAVTIKNDCNCINCKSDNDDCNDITTCLTVILIHKSSGIVGLAHLDGDGTAATMGSMIYEIKMQTKQTKQRRDNSFHLHIFGGFDGNRGCSQNLANEIINYTKTCPETIFLESACITPMNRIGEDGNLFPVIYGVSIDMRTLEIFPAEFLHKGRDPSRRQCPDGALHESLHHCPDQSHHKCPLYPCPDSSLHQCKYANLHKGPNAGLHSGQHLHQHSGQHLHQHSNVALRKGRDECLHLSSQCSRHNCRDVDLLPIYDYDNQQIIVPPFRYKPISQSWLTAPDKYVLEYISNNPAGNSPDFVLKCKKNN